MTISSVPAPFDVAASDDSADFWRGTADHRLILQRCDECGRLRFPPMPGCPWCGATTTTNVDAAGTGAVYSWIVVHRAFDERFSGDVPYTIATVDLTEGCRIFGRLDSPASEIAVGLPVTARYFDHDGWTEVSFATGEVKS